MYWLDAQESTALVEKLLGGYRDTQMLYVAATLGIADHIADGPTTTQDLALAVGAHPGALYRLLRALSGLGIFSERPDGRFEMTAAAELLRTKAPGSVRGRALSYGESWWWGAWGQTLECVRSGKTAFEQQHGQTLFEFLGLRPDAAAAFNANMASMTAAAVANIVPAIDLRDANCVADVGGGRGVLIAALLRASPKLRGILCEQEAVLAEARRCINSAGVADRCELSKGDIFTSVAVGADLYILKEVIHDWDDKRAISVLKTCRKAMREGARLILIERLIGAPNCPSEANLIDIVMLIMAGGMERTEAQYRSLLHAADFDFSHTVVTPMGLALLNAVAS